MFKVYRRRLLPILLGPACLCMGLILAVPILWSIWLSFYEVDPVAIQDSYFTGFEHYLGLFEDDGFLNSVYLLFVFIVATTLIEVILALSVALYVDQIIKPGRLFRTLLILPMFVIPVVSGLGFRYLFDPSGLLGSVFYMFGQESPDFLGDPVGAMFIVILQDVWRMWPFLFVIFFAGLQALPKEPVEAIRLDGAGFFAVCRYVLLPGLKGTLAVAVVLKVIESLKAFTEIYVMTGGGPGDSTSILSMFIVKQITEFSRFGFGSAASTLLLFAGLLAAIGFGLMQRRGLKQA